MLDTVMPAVRLLAVGICFVGAVVFIQPSDAQAIATCAPGRPDHMCLTTGDNYEGKYCTRSGPDCLTCLEDDDLVCTAAGMGSEPGYKDFSNPE